MDRVRVVVVGDSGVGKSSLIHLIAYDKAIDNPSWTIGAAVDLRIHEYKQGTPAERSFFIELWDVGGNKSHANTRGVFYSSGIHGVILCHDLSNKKSAQNLSKWVDEVVTAAETHRLHSRTPLTGLNNGLSQIPFLIVGTKLGAFMTQTGDGGLPRRRVRGCDDLQESLEADELFVDAEDASAFSLGSGNAVKLSRFFDRCVERRLKMEGSSIPTIHSGVGIAGGTGSGRALGPSASPPFSERRRLNQNRNQNWANKNIHVD